MSKQRFLVGMTLVAFLLAAGSLAALQETTLTGELVDKACFVDRGLHGPDHEACAKRCAGRGQPMGLLTDDGLVMLAVSDGSSEHESLKALAGQMAMVTGTLAEEDGVQTLTVTGAEAASN